MKLSMVVGLLSLSVSPALGCDGNSDEGDVVVACQQPASDQPEICLETHLPSTSAADEAKAGCVASNDRLKQSEQAAVVDACPTSRRLGACRIDGEEGAYQLTYLYATEYFKTTDDAKAACARLKGQFTPP